MGGIFINTFAAKDGSFSFDFTGQYTLVEPMKRLSYTMGEMKDFFLDAGRTVEVQFETTPEWVRVTEVFDAEEINSYELQTKGWSAILKNLKKYTEKLQ